MAKGRVRERDGERCNKRNERMRGEKGEERETALIRIERDSRKEILMDERKI